MPAFTRYASPAGNYTPVPVGSDGPWIAPFLDEIAPLLANARHQSNYAPLGVGLAVALPEDADRLTGNDLDSLLAPLTGALGLPQLRYAAATKGHGRTSTVCIGPVGPASADPHGFNHARARCDDLSVAGLTLFAHRIATQVTPIRWGPLQLDLAIRTGVLRDWVGTWAPLIDSLAPILGRRRDSREAPVERGRIVALALHHTTDALLGDAIDVELRWRLLARADGPALDYDVRATGSVLG